MSLLENDILYVRADTATGSFGKPLPQAAVTNQITGTVLDLRFADGNTTSNAADFTGRKAPLVILVNGQTRGAAAALAAQLRSAHKAIVIGSANSPEITGPDITVAVDAGDERTFQGNPFAELASDKTNSAAVSNDFLPFIDHTSEADLVARRVKDGEQDEASIVRAEPPPVIRDPALARALDLLKALAILHPAHG